MKAPDKIFLPEDIDWPSAAILTLGNQPGDVKYIRKDALLEWAREKKKQLLENESANNEPSDVAVGIIAGLDMLIGRLNSM